MTDTVSTALDAVGTIGNMLASTQSNSLIKFTERSRVEPIVLIANSLRELPYTPDLMKGLTSIFAGYYLQAVALSTNVGNIDTVRLLDKLNNKRSPIASAASSIDRHIATEAYKDGFPSYDVTDFALENKGAAFGKNTIDKAYDDVNLSVGKLLEVNISDGEHTVPLAVAIRLMVRQMPNSALVDILSLDAKKRDVKTRYHQYREGDLKFWRDLVLCQDIINDHRKKLMADSKGGFSEASMNRQKNRLAGIFSLNPSVNTISSIAIIDHQMAKQIERTARIRLSRLRDRDELMNRAGLMLFVVIDTESELATIYHNGIDTYTELTAKELKAAARGGSKEPDVGDILKSFLDSRAPSL